MNDDPRGPLDFEPDDEARWAHRRDPDLEPTPGRKRGDPVPVPRPPGASRYLWFVGLAFIVLAAVVFINAIGSQDVEAPTRGEPVAEFAAPLVDSSIDEAPNLAPEEGKGAKFAACDLRGEGIVNICDLYRSRPLLLVFFADRGGECVRQLDVLERLRPRFPRLSLLAVAVRGDRAKLRALMARHRWRFPVAWDPDGRLANVYGVAVCPQITFVRRGGRVSDTTFGELSEPELEAAMRNLSG